MNSMVKILLLFAAGGAGALSRFGLSAMVGRYFTSPEWLGTAIVNIIGCLCFGGIAEMFRIGGWCPAARTVILTGFFGAFTTFSTYMYEIAGMSAGGAAWQAGLGFATQNILGLCGIFLGAAVARCLMG